MGTMARTQRAAVGSSSQLTYPSAHGRCACRRGGRVATRSSARPSRRRRAPLSCPVGDDRVARPRREQVPQAPRRERTAGGAVAAEGGGEVLLRRVLAQVAQPRVVWPRWISARPQSAASRRMPRRRTARGGRRRGHVVTRAGAVTCSAAGGFWKARYGMGAGPRPGCDTGRAPLGAGTSRAAEEAYARPRRSGNAL